MIYVMLIAFKLNWILAISLGEQASWWLLPPLVVQLTVLARMPSSGFKLPLLLALVGIGIDSLHIQLGSLTFSGPWLPAFMLLMWLSFALVLPQLNHWLQFWLIPLVAFTGTFSYYLGSSAGHLTLLQGTTSLVALVVGWSLYGLMAWALLNQARLKMGLSHKLSHGIR